MLAGIWPARVRRVGIIQLLIQDIRHIGCASFFELHNFADARLPALNIQLANKIPNLPHIFFTGPDNHRRAAILINSRHLVFLGTFPRWRKAWLIALVGLTGVCIFQLKHL